MAWKDKTSEEKRSVGREWGSTVGGMLAGPIGSLIGGALGGMKGRGENSTSSSARTTSRKRDSGNFLKFASPVLGEYFDQRATRKAQDRANAYNDPSAIRARYEAAGFNPLLGIGNANPNYQSIAKRSHFGSAYTDALTAFNSDNRERDALEIERSRLELEKDKFSDYVKRQKLNPSVGGIYASINNRHNSDLSDTLVGADSDRLNGRNPRNTLDTEPVKSVSSSPLGFEMLHWPRMAPAEIVEEQYSDFGSFVYSPFKLLGDMSYTIGSKVGEYRMKRKIGDMYHHSKSGTTYKEGQKFYTRPKPYKIPKFSDNMWLGVR